jgi:N-acetyl sugar amidotransferase
MSLRFNLKYCIECVMPNTRPELSFNQEGVCSACVNSKIKRKINWKKRKIDFNKIIKKHKILSKSNDYNCIVPVSGGKDSIYQLYEIKKKFKMQPLAITWRTLARTKLGEENLDALRSLGVDHIDFTINPKIINDLTKRSFIKFGDSSYIDHLCIYNLIPNLALKFKIPLIIWGENMYLEYGGEEKKSSERTQNVNLINSHHILKNHTTEKWISKKISKRDLASFLTPDLEKLKQLKYEPIYFGYYFPWDIKNNFRIAKKAGFKERKAGPIMGLYSQSDVDCMNIVIHHYFKWLKFGFNRVTDHSSNEIRKKRLTRKKAISLVKKYDGFKPPKEYIIKFCKQINITEDFFWKVANKFRNKNIWKKKNKNNWYIENWIGGDKKIDKFPHTELTEHEKLTLK